MIGCLAYACFLLTLEALYPGSGVVTFHYIPQIVSCVTINTETGWRYMTLIVLNPLLILLVSGTVFASFLVTVCTLLKGTRTGNQDFRRVSITISIFTAVFLLCNLPLFVTELLQNVFTWIEYYAGLTNYFMSLYGFFLGYRFSTALNAALNPFLYFSFMPKFRVWLREGISKARNGTADIIMINKNELSMKQRSLSSQASKGTIVYQA